MGIAIASRRACPLRKSRYDARMAVFLTITVDGLLIDIHIGALLEHLGVIVTGMVGLLIACYHLETLLIDFTYICDVDYS
jgi:predicted nucleic acid-binding protein